MVAISDDKKGGATPTMPLVEKQDTRTSALLALVAKSPVMKEMPAAEREALMVRAADPDSKAFVNLFNALTEERTLLDRIDTNFSRIVNKIQDDFEVGLTEVSVKAARERMEQKHETEKEKEEAMAAGLIKSL